MENKIYCFVAFQSVFGCEDSLCVLLIRLTVPACNSAFWVRRKCCTKGQPSFKLKTVFTKFVFGWKKTEKSVNEIK